MALAEFIGSGALVADGVELLPEPFFSSTGTLTVTQGPMTVDAAVAAFTSEGSLEIGAGDPVLLDMKLAVLDDTLDRAPTSVVVTLTDGAISTAVVFDIDGTVVLTSSTDVGGRLGPLSLPVSETVGTQGAHTITATQGSLVATAGFTLDRAPVAAPITRGSDSAATDVPGSVVNGVRRWVLQDLMPGGLGSYIFPANPDRMTSPHREKILNARHTTAQSGQYHVTEGGPAPIEWKFSGFCVQALHDQLIAFHGLNRRFYVIDHRARAWIVTFVDLDLSARRRIRLQDGTLSDWGHDYTVTAYIYDDDPAVVA